MAESSQQTREDLEELSYLQVKAARLEGEKSRLEEEFQRLDAEHLDLEKEKCDLIQENKQLKECLVSFQNRLQEQTGAVKKQMDKAMVELSQKEEELAEKKALLNRFQEEQHRLEQEAVLSKQIAKKLEADNSQLVQNMDKAMVELSRKEEELAEKKALLNRFEEEQRHLEQKINDLKKDKVALKTAVQQLEDRIAVLEKRRDPVAIARVEFLRNEVVALIEKSVELERDALKESLPRQAGQDGDACVDAWRKDAVNRVQTAWKEDVAFGALLTFFGVLFRLRLTAAGIFSSLGLFFRKGAARLAIAAERAKCRQESASTAAELKRSRKQHDAQIAQERKQHDAQLLKEQKNHDAEWKQRSKELDSREQALNAREQHMERELRASSHRLAAALIFFASTLITWGIIIYGVYFA